MCFKAGRDHAWPIACLSGHELSLRLDMVLWDTSGSTNLVETLSLIWILRDTSGSIDLVDTLDLLWVLQNASRSIDVVSM